MKCLIPSVILIMIAIVLSFFIGCSIPLKLPITSTTGLTAFESGLWGYQQDLQNPDRAVRLPDCQGIAAKEYFRLKTEGYDACIMAGRLNGVGHVQASVLNDGVPLDLMSMQTTHILTESGIWRVQN